MVAELLRLKLRVLANGFRRARGATLRLLIAIVSIALAVTAAVVLARLAADSAWQFRALVVPLGALVLIGCLLIPVVTARDESLHARGFRAYGVGPTRLALALPITDLLSLPALLLTILMTGYVVGWSSIGGAIIELPAALLLVVLGLQGVRLGATFGAWLARHTYGDLVRAAVALVIVIAILALAIPIGSDPRYAFAALTPLADFAAETPLGALWAAPGLADAEQWRSVLWALGTVAALWIVWRIVVGIEFAGATVHLPHLSGGRLGLFRLAPDSPAAAIAARSISYWLRDPRYSSVFLLLPAVPALMLVAAGIGGIPREWIVLVPLPVVVSVLAWATVHNDVAYDSTAVWTHIVAGTRGIHDRLGRAVPPLLFGIVAIGIGAPLTAWGYGDWAVLPVVIGATVAVLLASVGIGSALSARFPYAAPPPGVGPFAAPQSVAGAGGSNQAIVFLGGLAAGVPSAVLGWLWLQTGSSMWSWASLGAGLAAGLLVLVIGLFAGAHAFERRGPELLAFAMRN